MANKKTSQETLRSTLDGTEQLRLALGGDNFRTPASAIAALALPAIGAVQADVDAHEADTANPHVVTKAQVGLGSADNTSDANKPISSATQTALDLKAAAAALTKESITGLKLADSPTFQGLTLASFAVADLLAVSSAGVLGAVPNQTANTIYAGPGTGAAAAPSFRALVIADLPFAGSALGVATLDSGGKIPSAQMPSISITDTFVVASEVAMLALTAERGDVAIRSDLNKSYILATDSPTTLADWKELLTPTDAVLSVAGQTGVISASSLMNALSASDLTSGTLAAARLPAFTGGDVTSSAGSASLAIGATKITSAMLNADVFSTAHIWPALQTAQGVTTTSPGWYAQLTGDAVPRVRVGLNAVDVASIGFGDGTNPRNLFLEWAAAATLRIGGPDAASPVAQTIKFQDVVAGTSNIAAPNATYQAPAGTGTGTGGSHILQVAPAGLTGTAKNAWVTALTIDSTKLATFAGNMTFSRSSPTITFSGVPIFAMAANQFIIITGNAGGFALAADSTTGYAQSSRFTITGGGADGVIKLTDFATTTTFNRLAFGGVTSSYPSLKRSGAGINVRLANDSADASLLALNLTASGTVLSVSPTGGLGYGTGAGGTVTQETDKTTGVTLNKVVGQITMNNASLADATTVSFTLTNSAIGANDMVVANHSSAGTAGAYIVSANALAAGSCKISVRNVSGGALGEAIVITFCVLKGVVA